MLFCLLSDMTGLGYSTYISRPGEKVPAVYEDVNCSHRLYKVSGDFKEFSEVQVLISLKAS